MTRSAPLYNKNAIEIISSIEKAPVGFEPAGAFAVLYIPITFFTAIFSI